MPCQSERKFVSAFERGGRIGMIVVERMDVTAVSKPIRKALSAGRHNGIEGPVPAVPMSLHQMDPQY